MYIIRKAKNENGELILIEDPLYDTEDIREAHDILQKKNLELKGTEGYFYTIEITNMSVKEFAEKNKDFLEIIDKGETKQ